MATAGMRYIVSIVDRNEPEHLIKHRVSKEALKPEELALYNYVDEHFRKHGELPSMELFKKNANTILPKAPDAPTHYADEVRKRFLADKLSATTVDIRDAIVEEKDPVKALNIMASAVPGLVLQANPNMVMDFRQAKAMLMQAYKEKLYEGDQVGINLGWETLDGMSNGLVGGDMLSVVGRPGLGKATTMDTDIVMADGSLKKMGAIQVGDRVASIDGKESEVYGVYYQGKRPTYRITFGDGRTAEVDENHLWEVGCKYWDDTRTMKTSDILRFREKARRYKDTLWIPLASGEFGGHPPPISPYMLGVLIGDGCLRLKTPTFTTMDPEIVDRVSKELPPGHYLSERKSTSSGKATTYAIVTVGDGESPGVNLVAKVLDELGLLGTSSLEKHLPDQCFLWGREARVALLQGLMDTDGTRGKKGSSTFSTSSPQLMYGVKRLVRSLGGKATQQKTKITTHEPHYRTTVILQDPTEAFYVPRKKELVSAYATHNPSRLKIVDVEYLGERECQCIAVTHERRLFLINDYVVTHNTFMMLYAAMNAWANQSKNVLFVSMEMNHLAIFQRMASMYSHLNLNHVKGASLSTKAFNKMKASLTEVEGMPASFHVAHGNMSANVDDIWSLAQYLNPEFIMIDGAYLLKHPNQRYNRFERVAENMRLMKSALCTDMDIPLAASWQFNREAAKKAKKASQSKKDTNKDKGDLEDIGFSDEIGQISSLALGLFEDESVETMVRRRVEIMKGRNGETGEFYLNWDFYGMNFNEYFEPDVETLQFV